MSKHDFGYFFHEGLSNMFSHGFMSFAAIGITVACLLIMAPLRWWPSTRTPT